MCDVDTRNLNGMVKESFVACAHNKDDIKSNRRLINIDWLIEDMKNWVLERGTPPTLQRCNIGSSSLLYTKYFNTWNYIAN